MLEVALSFVIRFDGEEDARALDITVDQRGSCNLHALPDPRLRRCGEDILTSLGVMKRVQPAKVGADLALFRAEMKLLDLAVDEVDGHLLTALDLPARRSRQQGTAETEITRRPNHRARRGR